MTDHYIMGVDIGTGSVKAVAVDPTGNVIKSCQEYYSTLSPEAGFMEQDPMMVMNAFTKVVAKLAGNMMRPPAAISLSSAMHGIMVVDELAKPLTNLIIWSDVRSTFIAQDLRKSMQGEMIYKQTGTPLHSMSPLCKIKWLNANRPDLFHEGNRFISIKEFIWFHMFGEFTIDFSIASATGLFDIHSRTWNDSALQFAGITQQHLSHPVPTSYIRNPINENISAQMGIPTGTIVCIGASDGCLANVGTHSVRSNVAALSIGTSGAVRVSNSKPVMDSIIMNFSYILDDKTFIIGAPVNNGGNIIQWLLQNFLDKPAPDYMSLFEKIEQIHAGSEGLIFLPYVYGERAPVWDEQACGVYFGIKPQHERNHFLRAAAEGICFALRQVIVHLEELAGTILQLNVGGGFVRSTAWIQMLADITGKKITVYQSEDASATGAAFMAMKAMGWINDYASVFHESTMQYVPDARVKNVYEKNFHIFIQLYPQLKNSMHLLQQPKD